MYRETRDYWQTQLMEWGPKVAIALVILLVTWLVARAVKWALAKAISRTPALQKHTPGDQHETIGHQLGTIAKLIIWLVGIMAALQFLGVGQILQPINPARSAPTRPPCPRGPPRAPRGRHSPRLQASWSSR